MEMENVFDESNFPEHNIDGSKYVPLIKKRKLKLPRGIKFDDKS